MQYYVNCICSGGDGSFSAPFGTIQQAADIAQPGDEILVYPGIYRENVNPRYAGTAENPITYRSVEPLKAIITGAEEVHDWVKLDGTVWKTSVPNASFPKRNPYTTLVSGDWFIATHIAHLGDVYLNGKSMYEVTDRALVDAPVPSKASWDPEFSTYVWYTEQNPETNETVLYANFHEFDPTEETVEISVRPACFYPLNEGINYIMLSGFTVCKAATQWAPPTAYQEGMIGPHWSKGWVIEDCEIYESKCSGISLGKYLQAGNDNKWLKTKYKDGAQTERECICQAQRDGWTKSRIGHHTVRRCNIHDCGQTGIVGHLGGVFSVIEENHIHHINNKQNLAGAEIGGIKMHAAIDVLYRKNHIHHCTRGLWLDWQAQGTRVTGNLFHDNALPTLNCGAEFSPELMQGNGEDVFVEVSHGPTLLDNNFFLSPRAVKLAAQGVALVHNLVAGSFVSIGIGTDNGAPDLPSQRYTPYHFPHETEVAGFMTFLHGDDRFYNNIFLQQQVHPALLQVEESMSSDGNKWDDGCIHVGTMRFNGYPTFEQWDRQFDGYCGMGSPSSNRYYTHLPVWSNGNVFVNGASPWEHEENYAVISDAVSLRLCDENGKITLQTNLFELLPDSLCKPICTDTLGMAFEPEERFENPDGSPISFCEDYFGCPRTESIVPGPVQNCNSVLKLN